MSNLASTRKGLRQEPRLITTRLRVSQDIF